MKEMVSKVLLAGDKYMLEMHLIQPECSYSTCGTFIKNKGRIQKFKKKQEIHDIFIKTNNPGQNIWNKVEKSSKSGQDMKSLISTFACFLTTIAKVFFPEGRLGTRLCIHPNLRFSLYFLIT